MTGTIRTGLERNRKTAKSPCLTLGLASCPPFASHIRFGSQWDCNLLIEHEQVLDALALGGEPAAPVEPVHGAVERLMRPAQVRRHQVGIVEVGQ